VLELLDVFTIPSLITPFEGALCGGACFTLAVFVLVKVCLGGACPLLGYAGAAGGGGGFKTLTS